jgi:decaprenylphospho-beta-D-ribofuranose 2-oxidase
LKRSNELLAGWGNVRPARCSVLRPGPEQAASSIVEQVADNSWIARGLGRSYGDSAQNDAGIVIDSTARNKILRLDVEKRTLTAQAGASLADILSIIVPAGFFLPVSPGTQYVTLGGAIAADVHGKNHHVNGSFGEHLESLVLQTASGQRLLCSREQHADIFHATQGGMGLTGLIDEATFRLLPIESTRISVVASRTSNLEETLARLESTSSRYRYSVSWIDVLASGSALGRGWVLAGDHVPNQNKEPLRWQPKAWGSVPFFMPSSLLSRTTCGWFNSRVYRRGIVTGDSVSLEQFFYPLDRIHHWNRIYGRRGFIEYQAVIPTENAHRGLAGLLERIASSGIPAFFAGIKATGAAGKGPLSFLVPGMTLGIDFPWRAGVEDLVDQLDRWVIKHGGRVYLAKDALLYVDHFRAMYPRLPEFQAICDRLDPERRLVSDQSRRLQIRSQD